MRKWGTVGEWVNTYQYLKCARLHMRRDFKENSVLCFVEEELPYHDVVVVLPGLNSGPHKAVGMWASQCALDLQREKQVSCHSTMQNVFRCAVLSEGPNSAHKVSEIV